MTYATSPEAKEKTAKLLRMYQDYRTAKTEEEKSRIGDAMTYADPVVWMMYKHLAYLGSDHEIATVGALREHCSDHGGICAKRFNFLTSSLKAICGADIRNPEEFADEMPIEEFYQGAIMDHAIQDQSFMRSWTLHEFWKEGDRVAKWENYSTK